MATERWTLTDVESDVWLDSFSNTAKDLDLLAGRITESRWCHLEWTQQTAVPQITTQTEASPTCTICRGLWGEVTRAA